MVRDDLEKVKFLYGVLGEKVFDFSGIGFILIPYKICFKGMMNFALRLLKRFLKRELLKPMKL